MLDSSKHKTMGMAQLKQRREEIKRRPMFALLLIPFAAYSGTQTWRILGLQTLRFFT
jgi:hypothetical protein